MTKYRIIIDGALHENVYETESQAWDGCYEIIGSAEGCIVITEEL